MPALRRCVCGTEFIESRTPTVNAGHRDGAVDHRKCRSGYRSPYARTAAAMRRRKARPRWLIAFFSSTASSASVRWCPAGTKMGS